jgi:hypothetical protein
MPFVTNRRLYLNADKTQVVEDGDPRATHLLAATGDEVSQADVDRYGLTLDEKAPEPSLLEQERAGLEAARNDPGRQEEARFRMQRVAELEAADEATKARTASANKQVRAPAENKSPKESGDQT